MKMVLRPVLWLTVFLSLVLGRAWADSSPLPLLEQASSRMIASLQDTAFDREDPGALLRLVERELLPLTDFRLISRFALGRHWRGASEAQREAFAVALKQRLLRTYVSALADYSGQQIRFVGERALDDRGQRVQVESLFLQPGRPDLAVNYMVYRTEAGWRLYDVSIQGISMVMTYRNSLNAQISLLGLDGVIESLRAGSDPATLLAM